MEDKKELLCLDNTDIFIPQFEERDVRVCAQKYLVGVCVAICTMGLLRVLDSYPFYDLSWNRCATFADSARIFFVIISLVVTTNFWKRVWRSQSLGVLDGFLCSYVALGLYLATHLFLHPAMLLVAFVVCALVALVGLRVERASREDVLCSVVSLIAAFSFALVILNYFGVAPVVKSQVDLAKGAGDTERDLNGLMRDLEKGMPLYCRGTQEVADTLQQFVHVECARLGLSDHEPQVVISLIGPAASSYTPVLNRICINPVILNSASGAGKLPDLIDSCAYECAHAYEWALIEGWVSGKADSPLGPITPADTQTWRREFQTPVFLHDQKQAYLLKDSEMRAMLYANGAAERYRDSAGMGILVGDFTFPSHIIGPFTW